jgi:transposase-like protein
MSQSNQRKKAGRDTVYEDAFKISVATEYLHGASGYRKLAVKYKLTPSTVIYFVKWYRQHFADPTPAIAPQDQIHEPAPSTQPPAKSAIQKQLEDALLKVEALETLISIANKELGIDILKNAGAKQSKP